MITLQCLQNQELHILWHFNTLLANSFSAQNGTNSGSG
jgi:hypothetical protein